MVVLVINVAGAQDTPIETAAVGEVIATVVDTTAIAPTEEVTAIIPTAAPLPTEPPVVVVDPIGSRVLDFIERMLPWFIVIGCVVLIIGGTLGRELIVSLGKSAPVPIREAGISGGESLVGSLENYAKTTELTLDDAGVAEFKKFFRGIVDEIRGTPGAGIPLAPSYAPPGQATPTSLDQIKADLEAQQSSLSGIPTVPSSDPWKMQYSIDGDPGDNS